VKRVHFDFKIFSNYTQIFRLTTEIKIKSFFEETVTSLGQQQKPSHFIM